MVDANLRFEIQMTGGANYMSYLTTKDLHEVLADTDVVVHCFTDQ